MLTFFYNDEPVVRTPSMEELQDIVKDTQVIDKTLEIAMAYFKLFTEEKKQHAWVTSLNFATHTPNLNIKVTNQAGETLKKETMDLRHFIYITVMKRLNSDGTAKPVK